MKVAPARRCRRYCNCAEIYALAGMGGLRRVSAVGCKDGTRLYRSSKSDCQRCAFKAKCCPNTPQRKVPRDLDEDARDVARSLANTPAYERSRHRRKKIEMLFAHLKRILKLGRLRLRGPSARETSSYSRPPPRI